MKYKYLNIIQYSDSTEYKEMKKLLYLYLITIPDLYFYFYYYDENIVEDYIIDEITHEIKIRGKETYVPGILKKSISCIKICNNIEYDYLIRTNISTIINFDKLDNIISQNESDVKVGCLGFFDNASFIYDNVLETFKLSTLIICLNKKSVQNLVSHENLLKYIYPDDVEISYLLSKYNIVDGIILLLNKDSLYVQNIDNFDTKYLCYRNKRPDRKNDVKCMKTIIYQFIYSNINILDIFNDNNIIHIDKLKNNSKYIYCLTDEIDIEKLKIIENKFILICYTKKYPISNKTIEQLIYIKNLVHVFTNNIEYLNSSFITVIPPYLKKYDLDILKSLYYKNHDKKYLIYTGDIDISIIHNYKYSICNTVYEIWLCLYVKTIPIIYNKNKIFNFIVDKFTIIYIKNIKNIDLCKLELMYNKLNNWSNIGELNLNYLLKKFDSYI